ncbi:MAG: hypothetical protein J7455_05960 [Roseiflexus sp.]|jgi:hypothetical protein|nr:hypothetical protein [Roseiflexus sp.]MBO9366387.1 hypothetical protein [Roseiflexus sp.]MBO9384301.1 hypothetical protein [Roseiflexus sp.]MBO9389466.1 hypothetical protein [Roseiflexus sp.]
MTDWTLYTITGAAALLVILLIIFVVRGKITIGEIEIGWPPTIKLTPKGDDSPPAGSKDEIIAKNEGKIRTRRDRGSSAGLQRPRRQRQDRQCKGQTQVVAGASYGQRSPSTRIVLRSRR